jgi:ubiquinone biosynthesis protein COQ9
LAALPDVPFDGWSMAGLAQAARTEGLDATMAERAFPGGIGEAVLHFIDLADRMLAQDAAEADLSAMGLSGKVKWLIRRRLDRWVEHREAIRRAVTLLAVPNRVASAAQANWRTADLIWHLVGDHPSDFTYYTKRASLTAVYSATLLSWMSDESEGFSDTWAFLDRRVAELGQIPKAIKAVERRLDTVTKTVERTLRGLGARRKFGRRFGLR